MGILEHTSNFQNCIKKTNKIPEYAREFKNEYLFIRGINKTCERFIKILDLDAKIFNSPQAYQLKLYIKRFVKAKELVILRIIAILNLKKVMLILLIHLIHK